MPFDAQLGRPTPVRAPGSRAVVATILGNALEVFDFTVYALFAVQIGRVFFPSASAFGQLMLSVGTFGVGFIARPLGSLVIGAYADRAGRKPALTLTILMMAAGTGLLGVTPGYATIGIAAPLLVVLSRLLQGFSAGGEIGAATTYLIEMAPPDRRGLYGSWQSASQGMAILAGGLVGFVASLLLTPAQLGEWGWRIPFLFGLLIAPVGFYIRSQLEDTAEPGGAGSAAVLSQLLGEYRRELLLATASIIGPTISVYVISSYMTTYAITVLKLPTSTALLAGLVAGVAAVVGGLSGGYLSDRVGRKPLTIIPQALIVLLVYPAFLLVTELRTGTALMAMIAVLTLLRSPSSAVVIVQVAECFPKAIRTTGLSIAYGVAVTVFGGTAQIVVTWLLGTTGNPMSPAWYLVAANAVSLLALILLRPRPQADLIPPRHPATPDWSEQR